MLDTQVYRCDFAGCRAKGKVKGEDCSGMLGWTYVQYRDGKPARSFCPEHRDRPGESRGKLFVQAGR